MKNSECISVIIPAYNVEQYIGRCLDSVLSQSYTNLEVIIVEDGSPDRCYEIATEYAQKDKRIQVIHQENQGLSSARNTGLDAAHGEWVAFVDSDDALPQDALEVLLRAADEAGTSMSMGGYYTCFNNNDNDRRQVHVKEQICRDAGSLQEYFLTAGRNHNYVWMKLYKRRIFDNVRFDVGKFYEDIYILPRLLEAAGSCAIVDYPIYYYVLRSGSISFDANIGRQMDGLRARLKEEDFIKEHYPRLIPLASDAVMEFACYVMGRICKVGRRNNQEYWKMVVDTYRSHITTAKIATAYLKAATFIFKISPVMLGNFCAIYSAIKNRNT